MSEMSERFARGLGEYLERNGIAPLDDDPRWADLGRLAVALMREPTAAMIEKATDCCFERPGADEGRYTVTVYLADPEVVEVWNAMCDAELVDDD